MRMFRQRWRWLLPVAVLFTTLGAGRPGDDPNAPLRIHVSPTTARAPADLYIYVSVARRHENRLLRVTAESEEFFRSSEAQLDGEFSARVTVFRFRELPPGDYQVRAELIIATGRTSNVESRAIQVY